MRAFVCTLLLVLLLVVAVRAQHVTQVQVTTANGRVFVDATVQNGGTRDAVYDLELRLEPPAGSGRTLRYERKGVKLGPGKSRIVRFATSLVPVGQPQMNTCLARSGSAKACVYSAHVRLRYPPEAPVASHPAVTPSPSPSRGLLVIAKRHFRNGKPNGELVATITLQNDGGAPASAKVELLFRDIRGGALDRSAEARSIPPGERRDVVIRTGLHCPDRIDTTGGSVQIRNIEVTRPAYTRVNVSGDGAIYSYYPPDIKITEGFYAIEVRLLPYAVEPGGFQRR